MKQGGDRSRRLLTARFVVMAGFMLAVIAASLTGPTGGQVDAQNLALTPRALLPMIANGSALDPYTATQTPSPTATPTPSPTDEPTAPPDAYDQVHLAWIEEPSTALTVVWRTKDSGVASAVQYRVAGAPTWQMATGGPRPSGTMGTLHEVTLRGLQPATAYEYRVQASGGAWSATFTARTAPAPGPASFDAIFFADTGLVGRDDGLATGTQQIVDEIARLGPLVLLGGGDYAYFDKDKRYGTLDATIDAWFNQVQPIASQAVLMPTYGNHEADPTLQEDLQSWLDRFPTPDGLNNRQNYSFDVGDVHFISLFAALDYANISDAQIAWLEQDITDAQARGMRWIIPYFHVVMFGDGDVHDEHWALRNKLGPVFERHGVQVALYAHDQAYERSYPLTGVTKTEYTVTSTSKTCYTPADGVIYVKTSPAGKESNISGHFSPFKTDPAPAWTAVRNNAQHHFTRLRVSAAGSITLEAWGVAPNDTLFSLTDSFKLTLGQCP